MTTVEGCDGRGPHDPGERRVYPMSDDPHHGNLILCLHCWAVENQYRHNRAVFDDETGKVRRVARHDLWPQLNWWTAKVYGEEE